MKIIELIYHNYYNLHRMHCRICSGTCHGEPRTGIEVCEQQYHAVHSSRTRAHTDDPTRRSTVRGCHKGKRLKGGCCAVAAASDRKSEHYVWWRFGKRENYVWWKLSFAFRVCVGLVGSSLSESDPVVIYQFSRL